MHRMPIQGSEHGTPKERGKVSPSPPPREDQRVQLQGKDQMEKRSAIVSIQVSATTRDASSCTCATSVSRWDTMRSIARTSPLPTLREPPDFGTMGSRKFHGIQMFARCFTCFLDAPARDQSLIGQGSLPLSGMSRFRLIWWISE